jgi:multidrug resistance efflux pump
MRGKWLLFGGAAVLLAIAAGSWSVYQSIASRKPAAAAPESKPAVYQGSEVSLNGTVQAQKVVPVAAPMDGVVDAVFAEVGQEVAEGQLLARVKSAQLDAVFEAATADMERAQTRVNNLEAAIVAARLEVSRARADASRAKTDFDRAEKVFQRQEYLMKEGATPRLVFEKSQREYEAATQDYNNKSVLASQAESQLDALNKQMDAAKRVLDEKNLGLDQAKADVSAGELVSPVDGIVVARHAGPGEEVTPTMTDFFQIATELGSLEVLVDPEPPVMARIKPGQDASIHIAEFAGDLPGKVREIRGSQVVVEFVSPSPAIRPGLSANVRIRL